MNENKNKSRIIVLVALAVAVVLLFSLARVSVVCGEDSLVIKGFTATHELQWEQIANVKMQTTFYSGMRIVGVELITVAFGRFELADYGQYRLDIYKNTPLFIIVTDTNGLFHVFNLKTTQDTLDAYSQIAERMGGTTAGQ